MKKFFLIVLFSPVVYSTGYGQENVGVNIANPLYTLDVVQSLPEGWQPVMQLRTNTITSNTVTAISFSTTNLATASNSNYASYIGGIRISSSTHGLVFGTSISSATPPQETMRLIGASGGRLGIGITNPLAGLHISGTTNATLMRVEGQSGNTLMNLNSNGRLGLGTNSPIAPLHITGNNASTLLRIDDADGNRRIDMYPSGNVRFFQGTGDGTEVMALVCNIDNAATSRLIVDQVQIKGGSDVAEYFNIDTETNANPASGMVVVLGNTNTGNLEISNKAYDKKVAGVISGANGLNPGLMMSQKGSEADGAYPVAIGGRVYVKADATRNAIQIGDMVTTSNLPGHVMKATDKRRMTGAVVGKAMTPLAKGETGLIMILVTLQ